MFARGKAGKIPMKAMTEYFAVVFIRTGEKKEKTKRERDDRPRSLHARAREEVEGNDEIRKEQRA